MSKKDENVIKQTVTALNRIADTLDDLDTAIWNLALEAAGIHDKIESVDTKIDKLLAEPLKVEVDYEKLADAIIMALGYTVTQEVKTPEVSYTLSKKVT